MQLQKEVKSNPKWSSCKKVCGPQEGHCKQRCEIYCMVAAKKWQANGKDLATKIHLNCHYSTITAISWPLPWILHHFHSGLLGESTQFL